METPLTEEVFIPTEEKLILIGLKTAVREGRMTEDEMHDYLSEYIDKRHAEMLFYPIVPEEVPPS